MDHLKKFSKELGITLIVNLHQVNVALNYSDRILGVNSGKIVFDGRPDELTSGCIAEIYGAESEELIEGAQMRYAN
jgi:phosphonate transport system ATP-binding protein